MNVYALPELAESHIPRQKPFNLRRVKKQLVVIFPSGSSFVSIAQSWRFGHVADIVAEAAVIRGAAATVCVARALVLFTLLLQENVFWTKVYGFAPTKFSLCSWYSLSLLLPAYIFCSYSP